jgi:hypothetical protein
MTDKEFLMEMHGLVEDLKMLAQRYEAEAETLTGTRQIDMYSKSDGVMKAVQVIKDRGWA